MEPLTRIGDRRQSCDGFGGDALLPASEGRGQKLGPPLEVPIKAAFGDAEPCGKRLDRERAETGLGDELKCSFGPVGGRQRGLVESLRASTFTRHGDPILPYSRVLTMRASILYSMEHESKRA